MGFKPDSVETLTFDLTTQGYDETKGREFDRQLMERVAALPGVRAASLASTAASSRGGRPARVPTRERRLCSKSSSPDIARSVISRTFLMSAAVMSAISSSRFKNAEVQTRRWPDSIMWKISRARGFGQILNQWIFCLADIVAYLKNGHNMTTASTGITGWTDLAPS